MKQGIKTYKFNFHAKIGDFILNAPGISSPLTATWKRSSESVSTTTVEMSGGKANFNQTITLPLNMYYEESAQQFQQKKTLFTFTMQTPKGQKQAGIVYLQVAQILNNKQTNLSNVFPLEKCPVKDSKVQIEITAELIGQAAISDNMSVDSSILNQSSGPSTLSIQSKKLIPSQSSSKMTKEQQKITTHTTIVDNSASQLQQKIKIISNLQNQVKKLTKQKETLQKELQKQKASKVQNEPTILRQQLLKSKAIQQKLQSQMNNLRSENVQHERQLQKMRIRMQNIYELLFSNLNSLY